MVVSSGPSHPTSNLRSKAANTELISIQEILFPMHILGPNPNGKLTKGLIYGNKIVIIELQAQCLKTFISEPRLHLSGRNWCGCLTQAGLLLIVWWQSMKEVPGGSW